MDSKISSAKCPQCGFVSFATAESCKRCAYTFVRLALNDEQTTGSAIQAEATATPGAGKRSRQFTKRARVMAGTVISLIALLGVAFSFHLAAKQPPPAISTVEMDPISLRSRYAEQMKPATEKFANDLFVVCRDAERQRLETEAERLNKVMRENEEDFSKSQADKLKTLISIKPEVLAVQEDMDRLKEMLPTKITVHLAGSDSDILFYNVTGGLARNVSQQFVNW